jgi:hypothetical protein
MLLRPMAKSVLTTEKQFKMMILDKTIGYLLPNNIISY